ncbi:hypothetical protein [Methanorbis furvi]|uniref:Uncharacterized protein n=1 Tax=Methanorbis furvi TaxID=3028299 RepID=A0AAE4M953_9EURY|nr:hypothetical protein [Methanocorpusculaceae archaeon Ag1]
MGQKSLPAGKLLSRGIPSVLISLCCFGFVISGVFFAAAGSMGLTTLLSDIWTMYGLSCLYLLSFAGGLFWVLRSRPAKWYYAVPFLVGMPALAFASFHLTSMSSWISDLGITTPAYFAFPVAFLLFSLLLAYPLSSTYREVILVLTGLSILWEIFSLAAFGLSAVSPYFLEYFSTDPNMLMFLRGAGGYLILFPLTGLFLIGDTVERLKEDDS